MIVDDEAIIVEGMKKAVDWALFDCTVCGSATDGESALAAIRELKPDMLFTDVCMPGMDGLTMLAALKLEMPQLQTAILTGYHDFSYAQQAIRLGVTRLLTKPSRMEDIQEAILAMREKLAQAAPDETAADTEQQQNSGSFIVRQALSFLESSYASKLTLQDLADHCYVSQWHLSKLLNRHTGKSFYDLLNAKRIERAKELLSEPGLRIADIGEQVGYNDTAHFCRIFKKLEGVSANEFRNRIPLNH